MRKIISFVLCLCVCVCALSGVTVFAADTSGTCGDAAAWSYDSATGALTITGSGAVSDYASLTSIPWKSYCRDIKSISIGEGITEIGNYALSWCEAVESVTLPSTMTRLGMDSFGWCSSLKNVTLNEGLTAIESEAFVLCTALETINLPSSLTSISGDTFMSCSALKSITMTGGGSKYAVADGVLYDNENAMLVCYPVGKTDTAFSTPENITKIGTYAFMGNNYLKSLTLTSVEEIEREAFYTCTALYDVTMPCVKTVSNLAFYRCENLVSVTFPATTVSLGKEVFRNCTNLQLAMFENDAVTLGEDVFKSVPYVAIVANNGSTGQAYAFANDVTYYGYVSVVYGGTAVSYDPAAFIVNDATTMVPLRQVFEMLGAEVSWDDATNTAIAAKDGTTLSIQIGSDVLYRNGEAVSLPETGKLIADRTYVPLRAVSEAFGNTVVWDNDTNTVYID